MVRTSALLLSLAGALASPLSAPAADASSAREEKRTRPIGVGDVAPDFTLEDQDGRRHRLSAERGTRPVVLVFYRGHW